VDGGEERYKGREKTATPTKEQLGTGEKRGFLQEVLSNTTHGRVRVGHKKNNWDGKKTQRSSWGTPKEDRGVTT